MASNPTLQDQTIEGIRITVTDHHAYLPVESGVQILWAFYRQAQISRQKQFVTRIDWLNKISGSQKLHQMLTSGVPAEKAIAAWKTETDEFNRARAKYLLY
jgi:uncharacterized protein YbbC (DUF1343 family)